MHKAKIDRIEKNKCTIRVIDSNTLLSALDITTKQ